MTEALISPELIFKGERLSKRYSSKAHSFILAPIDIELFAGEITGVVGENGDGKTTLLSLVSGRLSLTSGAPHYPYLDKTGKTTLYDRQQAIAMLTQELPSWKGRLIDNLHFYAALRGIKGRQNEEWVLTVLDRLGLMKYKDATWKQISGGYRTRFSLARAIVQKPNLLVLDEPLANLDINTQLVFLDDLRDLVKTLEQPITILISSQHLHEIERISDKIIFIRDGKPLYNGPMATFEADRLENSFELTCDLPKDQLEALLKESQLLELKAVGENYLLRFPRTVESKEVLRILLQNDVKITLFRDISQSTRKLFRMEE